MCPHVCCFCCWGWERCLVWVGCIAFIFKQPGSTLKIVQHSVYLKHQCQDTSVLKWAGRRSILIGISYTFLIYYLLITFLSLQPCHCLELLGQWPSFCFLHTSFITHIDSIEHLDLNKPNKVTVFEMLIWQSILFCYFQVDETPILIHITTYVIAYHEPVILKLNFIVIVHTEGNSKCLRFMSNYKKAKDQSVKHRTRVTIFRFWAFYWKT